MAPTATAYSHSEDEWGLSSNTEMQSSVHCPEYTQLIVGRKVS